ncbi:MAG: two-component sensor histidine kinase [Sphingomonadaceae bacterium]|nr:two-component sensor histidine kinase [Sphingomonadaceae bacterium]
MKGFGGIRIWPRSLYAQILLVAASALLVAQGINSAWLLAGTRNRAIAETSAMVVSRVANQIERQQATGTPVGAADWWGARQQRGSERQRRRPPAVAISLGATPVQIVRAEVQDDLSERAQEFLRQSGIDLSGIRISVVSVNLLPRALRDPQLQRWQAARFRNPDRPLPHKAVLLSARLPDGQWVNAAGLVRPNENASLFALLLQTFTLFIAVMIPLALVAHRIAKPLSKLTDRVQQVGLAGEIEPLTAQGPEDVKHLIDAFNAMHSRVSNLLGEKDVMLGAIGHDLKTPLAALRVRIESVEDDDEREKMAATIDEMVTILDDILTLARLGKSGEALQSVDIGALVESVSDEYEAATFDASGIRVIANVRPVLLRRALRNIVGNAITYGQVANVAIAEAPGHVEIIVDDRGPGIDPDMIESMFEPFTRAEKSRSRATGGSGLGLTIARAITRAHGGDVILQNRSTGGLRAILSFRR